MKKNIILTLAVVAIVSMGTVANAAVIYSDDFSGSGASGLHDTTPDTTTGGVKWVAASNYKADGSSTALNQATMSLAFTPVDGLVYTLDAQFETIDGGQWVQFGFGNGQPTTGVNWSGRAWNLLRASSDTTNVHSTYGSGFGGAGPWTSLGLLRYDDDMDVRIVLDTTAATWTARYYAKAGNVGTYTEVIAAAKDITDETIDAIGFSTFNSGDNSVEFNSFSLTVIPEPATMSLLALGGLGVLARRRRRS
jgi:hypothetical protein